MAGPTIDLDSYTFKFGISDFDTRVSVSGVPDGGAVRSIELDYMSADGFSLVSEGDYVYLVFPNIEQIDEKPFRKFMLRFVVGYTSDGNGDAYDELDVVYVQRDVYVYAVEYEGDPDIDFIENLATRVDEGAEVVIHGHNLTDGLSVKMFDGGEEHVMEPEDLVFDIGNDGTGTVSFSLYPGMLGLDDRGHEPCGSYSVYFGYGRHNYDSGTLLSLIRYKYDSDTEEMQKYSTENFTRESKCYETGSMSLVYDTVDEFGNAVLNPQSDPASGDTIVVRRRSDIYYENNHYTCDVDIGELYGLLMLNNEAGSVHRVVDGVVHDIEATLVQLSYGDAIVLSNQTDPENDGLWFVSVDAWVRRECDLFVYTMVRLKYSKNLTHKSGELKLDGVQLSDGDLVWLANQLENSEDGIWVARTGNWEGFNPYQYDGARKDSSPVCPDDCFDIPSPWPVGMYTVVDLGVRVSYPVDLVCRDDVPYKCGTRNVCGHVVEPGAVVALLNQEDGGNGMYLVKCGDWEKVADLDALDVKGTSVDMTGSMVVQNDIDFCECGGVFHIDYFFLTPTCYLHHMQRTVKIQCGGASIVPNPEGSQVRITEYVVTVGEEATLVGNRGRVPGDPVKEDCTVSNDDYEVDFGLHLVETRQFVQSPACVTTPACSPMCDMPRFYNLRTTDEYRDSNDANGFTIKFWRLESDGWHLYAYVGSGTRQVGMDYWVYHLHVKGRATENLVDVNEHDWFTVNGGVLATGDGADSFGLCDDTWEFQSVDDEGVIHRTHTLDSSTLYMPWRISCTTNILAHCYEYDGRVLRTSCADMLDAEKSVAASGEMCVSCMGAGCASCDYTGRMPQGYLHGMPHLFAVAYYREAMSKSRFVAEYNAYDPNCIWYVPDAGTEGNNG